MDNIIYNDKYIYIISNAYTNDIRVKIIMNKYKYYLYHEFISYYFKDYYKICITGSHGKSSTSDLLHNILTDYSYIIGISLGEVRNNKVIIEGCEYKESFLVYNPDILLILNIDYDHPDYYKDINSYINAFYKLYNKSKLIIVNGDDNNILSIKDNRCITYGMNSNNDYIFTYKIINNKTYVYINDIEFIIPYVGLHYAYNFVGAYIICKIEGILDSVIRKVLEEYRLPNRRMELINYNNKILIADYAHHPSEIRCLAESINYTYKDKKVCALFESHTISRSIKFMSDFKKSLDLFNNVYLLRIYTSVREDSNDIEYDFYNYLKYPLINYKDIDDIITNYDVILFIGAGDIYNYFLNYK